jgi:hypothetical protein
MTSKTLSASQQAMVSAQVDRLLAGSQAWHTLPPAERESIRRHTATIAASMAAERLTTLAHGPTGESAPRPGGDPYHQLGVRAQPGARALAEAPPSTITSKSSNGSNVFKAEGVAAGVTQTARMVREIDFPAFVSQLVHGTFDAVVQSSITQMKAYGELVRSVAMSLNEFRDQNVSMGQARDHLVQRYPTLFQISTDESGGARVSSRPGAENATLPNFRQDLGLSDDVDGIDDDTIEEKLVPAARDDYARSRQKLLATMVLMGINRIVVTDGKINAKVQFSFQAKDKFNRMATATDYENMGIMKVAQGSSDGASGALDADGNPSQVPVLDAQGKLIQNGQGNRYATGQYQSLEQPIIKIAETSQSMTDASLTASGSMMGEVQLNFKSDVFPLEKMLDSGQMFRLNAIQSGPASAAPAVPAAAPAPAPATSGSR